MATTFAELRALSTEDLVKVYDDLAASTQLGLGFYREEIARRAAADATREIVNIDENHAKPHVGLDGVDGIQHGSSRGFCVSLGLNGGRLRTHGALGLLFHRARQPFACARRT